MSEILNRPVTKKCTLTTENTDYLVASSSMQGWRNSMEDAHTCLLTLPGDESTAYFAVYDGHGGTNASRYCSKHLHKYILQQPEFKEGNIEQAIKYGYTELDKQMQDDNKNMKYGLTGTTAVSVLIKNDKLYCGNVGDSRAIGSIDGIAEILSKDHKPDLAEERKRIESAGGFVEDNRVMGNLAMSRALGDYLYKQNKSRSAQEQLVISYPDVIIKDLNDKWEFLIIACDGIWDVMNNEHVLKFVRQRIAKQQKPNEICEELANKCLAPSKLVRSGVGFDNITVILVCLLKYYENYQKLAHKCAKDSVADSKPLSDPFTSTERLTTRFTPLTDRRGILKKLKPTTSVHETQRHFSSLSHTQNFLYKVQLPKATQMLSNLSRTWQALNTNETENERLYIRNEARQLFRQNKAIEDATEIEEHIREAKARLDLAIHYKNPYPRPVHLPTWSLPPSHSRTRYKSEYITDEISKPIYIKSYQVKEVEEDEKQTEK